jgi:hypothetical protein
MSTCKIGYLPIACKKSFYIACYIAMLSVKISFFFPSEWREAAERLKREKEAAIMNALLLCYRQMQ